MTLTPAEYLCKYPLSLYNTTFRPSGCTFLKILYIIISVVHPIYRKDGVFMDFDKIVCNCQSVTNGMIKSAVDAGASTLEEVQDATGAGTVCGACIEDIEHLIEQFVKEREQN